MREQLFTATSEQRTTRRRGKERMEQLFTGRGVTAKGDGERG